MNRRNWNSLLIVVVLVLGLLVLLPALAMPMMVGGMMSGGMIGGMMGGWTWGGGYWWSWVMMLLFWVLLIGGVALVVAWLFRQGYVGGKEAGSTRANSDTNAENRGDVVSSTPSALDILRQRYARGEITKETYEQMKGDILAD